MKILKIIHGYPPLYNAGSEVYSQLLCHGLSEKHEVHVFTREENPFSPDFSMRILYDSLKPTIKLHLVNIPLEKFRYRFQHPEVDQIFSKLLDTIKPDIIHIGHLNHLSTSLVYEITKKNIPIVYTLHDYWLMCPRGQFIQRNATSWALCDGQEDKKCATQCYSGYFTGAQNELDQDVHYWTDWIHRRMAHIRDMVKYVNLFIAPSKYLYNRYIQEFNLPQEKLIYLDYGFDLSRLKNRQRKADEAFTFGYIGTHIPAKGIQDLIQAFGKLKGNCKLRIWGRPRGQNTEALHAIASQLPKEIQNKIEWRSEYRNENIVCDVFNHTDCIVVPSIWVENSPLVIHEALQMRIPVITANTGGMSEYIHHEKNGLLFNHRDINSLAIQMQRLLDDPQLVLNLSQTGYLQSSDGNIPDLATHVTEIEKIYASLLTIPKGPWRITFDTNPDDCNLSCIMCEDHSPYSKTQKERIAAKIPKRRMDINLIKKILEESKNTPLREIIPSTMGEPLVYKNFEDIIKLCHEYKIKLNLTTNGTFPIKGVEEWAKLIVPVTSDVKISWNGASKQTQEKVMLGTKWEKVLDNLKKFITIRNDYAKNGGNYCRVTLQLTFLETNVDELADIVKLGLDLGVDRIKGHHLWAHFDEIKNLSMRRNNESIRKWNKAVQKAQAIAQGTNIKLENIYLLDENSPQDLAPGGECPFLNKEAWVATDGRFSPCCAPDKERRKLGDFGSLLNKTMDEIWQSKDYQALNKDYMQHEVCKSCNMRKPNDS